MRLFVLIVAALSAGVAPAASAAAPAPCGGVPQISDASGDGHHSPTDVVAAWFSEEAGRLQAVIKVRAGTLAPEHSDAEVGGSGLAIVFQAEGQQRYVRARVPLPGQGAPTFDYGTYSEAGGFTVAGATTGVVEEGGEATATIDLPAALGVAPGTVLQSPHVLTYDGITGGVPDWVDHAPGGVSPTDIARGADYVLGSCDLAAGRIIAVRLSAPSHLEGAGRARLAGSIVPARPDVAVELALTGGRPRTIALGTRADGTFSAKRAITRTTRVQASAEGISSETVSIEVRSRVRIRKAGRTAIRGRVNPAGPGRLLLLPANSVDPIDSQPIDGRRFRFNLGRDAERGAVQVVYVPANERAERSVSNTLRLR